MSLLALISRAVAIFYFPPPLRNPTSERTSYVIEVNAASYHTDPNLMKSHMYHDDVFFTIILVQRLIRLEGH